MSITFVILAALTVVSAIAAMSLRNLVHCALCLVMTFGGLAAFYLKLGAPFVGWAQVLVYVGAVAILIVFAILLTRSDAAPQTVMSPSGLVGIAIAVLVFSVLTRAIVTSAIARQEPMSGVEPTVRDIGNQLMTRYVLPLEATGLLLTAATIGAVIIALEEPASKRKKMDGDVKVDDSSGKVPVANPPSPEGHA